MSRRPNIHQAVLLLCVTVCACGGSKSPDPADPDPTCAEYTVALNGCLGQAGFAQSAGDGFRVACEQPPYTEARRAYFRCATRALNETTCDLDDMSAVHRALNACYAELRPPAD
jgi:hypothetical protein